MRERNGWETRVLCERWLFVCSSVGSRNEERIALNVRCVRWGARKNSGCTSLARFHQNSKAIRRCAENHAPRDSDEVLNRKNARGSERTDGVVALDGQLTRERRKRYAERKIVLVLQDAEQEDLLIGARVLRESKESGEARMRLRAGAGMFPRPRESMRQLTTVEVEDRLEVFNLEELAFSERRRSALRRAMKSSCALLVPCLFHENALVSDLILSLASQYSSELNACVLNADENTRSTRGASAVDTRQLWAVRSWKLRQFSGSTLVGIDEAGELSLKANVSQRLAHALQASNLKMSSPLLLPFVDVQAHTDARHFFELYDAWVERPNVREPSASGREAWLISLIQLEVEHARKTRREGLRDLAFLREELETVAVSLGHPAGALPSLAVLRANGHDDLVDAIHFYHGGVTRVCRLLGMRRGVRRSRTSTPALSLPVSSTSSPSSLSSSPRAVEAAVPGETQPLAAKRASAVSDEQRGRRQKGQRNAVDDEELKRGLLLVSHEHGSVGETMPNDEELRDAGRTDLRYAVRKRGGYRAVASQLGLRVRRKGSMTKYADSEVLKRDLQAFVRELARERREAHAVARRENDTAAVEELDTLMMTDADQDVLPSLRELRRAGRRDLINAIKSHGGLNDVARKLNWRLSQQARRDALSSAASDSESE